MASTLNVTRALQNPGQEFPFEADCLIDEMEVLGDPVLFTDAKASGLIVGVNQNLSVTGEAIFSSGIPGAFFSGSTSHASYPSKSKI